MRSRRKKVLCFVFIDFCKIAKPFLSFPALEALINSLRSHLTRLTSELASHQDLLTELRNLRDSDSRALKEKGADIIKLREEVQRLAGEVEVLRGVIEEGLKERRASREIPHVEQSVADTAMSQDLEEGQEQEQEEGNEDEVDDEDVAEEDGDSDETSGLVEEEGAAEPFDPVSIREEQSRINQAADKTTRSEFAESMTSRRFDDKEEPTIGDKTMRTDYATVGSTNLAESMNSRRFVDKEELDRISAEVEERRSNRSSNSIGSQSRRARSPSSVRRDRRATVEDEEEKHERLSQTSYALHYSQNPLQTAVQPEPQTSNVSHHHHSQSRLQATTVVQHEPQTSNISHHHSQNRTTVQPEPPSFRPSTPAVPAAYHVPTTTKQATAGPARFQEQHVLRDEPETPFPQIRGEHLERLFFSAPEHNAKTCTVCYRRRHRTGKSPPWSSPSLYPRKDERNTRNAAKDEEEDEDEGFGEGSEEAAADMDRVVKDKGKQRDYVHFSKDPGRWRQAGRRDGLPPQTVVVRVIRELEDDFTHYKRYVILVGLYNMEMLILLIDHFIYFYL